MTENTLLLTGLPRSGTTLCCHMLNEIPDVLALHEPMTPQDLPLEAGEAANYIWRFARQTRRRVLEERLALSRHKNGLVPENPVGSTLDDSGLRTMDVQLGVIQTRDYGENFRLVLKQNAMFSALLPMLPYPCYAVIRNPLSVLASWNSVNLPVNEGRIPGGERYDRHLARKLDAQPDRLTRQIAVLEWFMMQYAQHVPPDRILRYEDFVEHPEIVGSVMELGPTPKATRKNRNADYDKALMEPIHRRLLADESNIWQFYSKEEVDQVYQQALLS